MIKTAASGIGDGLGPCRMGDHGDAWTWPKRSLLKTTARGNVAPGLSPATIWGHLVLSREAPIPRTPGLQLSKWRQRASPERSEPATVGDVVVSTIMVGTQANGRRDHGDLPPIRRGGGRSPRIRPERLRQHGVEDLLAGSVPNYPPFSNSHVRVWAPTSGNPTSYSGNRRVETVDVRRAAAAAAIHEDVAECGVEDRVASSRGGGLGRTRGGKKLATVVPRGPKHHSGNRWVAGVYSTARRVVVTPFSWWSRATTRSPTWA